MMAGLVCRFAACCCALAIGARAVAAAPGARDTLTQRLVADARDGQLDDFDFLAAALVASGVKDDRELTGWALDSRMEVRLLRSVDTTGHPIWAALPTDDFSDATTRRGQLLQRPDVPDSSRAPAGDQPSTVG